MSSEFRIRSRLAGLALASVLGLLQPALAVPGESCGSVDRLIVALRFAQAVFPELKGKEFTVSFAPGSAPDVHLLIRGGMSMCPSWVRRAG